MEFSSPGKLTQKRWSANGVTSPVFRPTPSLIMPILHLSYLFKQPPLLAFCKTIYPPPPICKWGAHIIIVTTGSSFLARNQFNKRKVFWHLLKSINVSNIFLWFCEWKKDHSKFFAHLELLKNIYFMMKTNFCTIFTKI